MYSRRVQNLMLGAVFCIFVTTWFYWPTTARLSFDLERLNPTKVALLMETRALAYLPALLSHFISVIEPEWTFRFVGSPEAIALIFASMSLSRHIKTGKLIITELPARYSITTQEAVSITFTNLEFYKEFLAPVEWLLVFQVDSMICAASEHSIEDWIRENYTWLGAPWDLDIKGGNGGLSLRHVPHIIELLEKEQREEGSGYLAMWTPCKFTLGQHARRAHCNGI